jgi:hypothetical protein
MRSACRAALRWSREGRPIGGWRAQAGTAAAAMRSHAGCPVTRERGAGAVLQTAGSGDVQRDRGARAPENGRSPVATGFTRRCGVLCLALCDAGPRPMRWFRSNAGRDAWLALFALACQFVFTFGHVHLIDIGVSDTAAISAGAPASAVGGPASPRQRAPSGLTQDFCALCNNISLAGALVLPAPPAVILPSSFIRQPQWTPTRVRAAARDHLYFNARGPPHA